MSKKIISLAAVVAVLVAAATAMAAGTNRATAASKTKSSKSTPQCSVSDLTASLKAGSPGAGQRYATLTLKNTSGETCGTGGYVGLGLRSASGKKLHTDVVRIEHSRVKPIYLTPGHKASTLLHWSVIPSGSGNGSGTCVKPPAQIAITPPNDYKSILRSWHMGTVCEGGRISINPLHKG